jgi:two-component system, sensor histidine kinase and response regulator
MSANPSTTSAPGDTSTVSAIGDREHIDLRTLVERCMGDASLAGRLLERFRDRLPGAVAEIERCLDEANWTEASKRAHSLKGEAGSLAAHELHRAAAALEKHLKSDPTTNDRETERLAGALRVAADETLGALPRLLDALTTSVNSAN